MNSVHLVNIKEVVEVLFDRKIQHTALLAGELKKKKNRTSVVIL